MRPVRLEAEGFTCYRDRQAPLDFTGLSLFAIAGPTGAGKSSILDTMLFALYGVVPRIGKQGIGEFIAHGRDAMSVTLDFSVHGATYRVVRRVKRGRTGGLSTTALLAELPAGGAPERSIAEQVKPVNEAIERLLGLDFAAFTQTVILPQGEFARFLRSEKKEQRAILQHLLRHDVYERMRGEAERRRAALQAQLTGVERELRAFEHATEDAVREKAAARDAAVRRLADLAEEKAGREQARDDLRLRRQLTEQVQQQRRLRSAIEARAAQVAALQEELAAAQRAGRVQPRVEAHEAADVAHRQAVTEQQAAGRRQAATGEALAAAEQRLASAAAAAEEIPALADRIRAIDEIKGDLVRCNTLTALASELATRLPAAERRVTSLAAALEAARETMRGAAADVTAARQAVDRIAYDAAEHQRMDALALTAAQVRAGEREIARLQASLHRCEAEVTRAQEDATRRDRQSNEMARACELAIAAEQESARALELAVEQHQAAAVRAHLHPGEPCPVCLQVVTACPDTEPVPALATLKQALTAARERVTSARAQAQQSGEQRATALARAEAARRSRDQAAEALRTQLEARDASLEQIAAAFAGGLPLFDTVAGGEDLLVLVESRRAELQEARDLLETATARRRQAESAAAAAEVSATRAEGDWRAAVDEQLRLAATRQATADELAGLRVRIASVSTHDSPPLEREALAQRREALEAERHAAQQLVSAARQAHAAASEGCARAEAAVAKAADAASAARLALARALSDGRFDSVAGVQAALRDAAAQQALEAQTRAYEMERSAVLGRLADLEPRIAGQEVSAGQLQSAEEAWAQLFADWRQADHDASALTAECGRLEAALARRSELVAEEQQVRRQCALHTEMAADLKGDAFQEFLLTEAFQALVAGASIRMRQMSNRYTLEWEDGAFFVIDHDNAGERRRAETLSGGETFMASLCLALQLSDEVLRTTGALQMDSLFIDEGFGTLDADALSEVTDTMEALRQDGGRLIGVISHRPELTDRLPGCIRVQKGTGESTWRLERIG